ncbi:MAG TPA: ATP-binding cassette domain-containing protein [Isosphaeraceae bacterium]|jgi:osmoprotectant transport system ATP-binding protein|nr:ATP-binding cassette domain-containing protein [Isosphaeraceae bacterium]
MGRTETAPAVAWRNVSKAYPGHAALHEVSLEAAQGEFLAILGTSGSGKTTLLKMVNRLLDPTAGEVIVEGRPTHEWDPIALRRSTGYVIQEVGLMPHMTILANVGIVPRLLGIPPEECRSRASHRLQIVGLDPERFGPMLPHQLSGGQRQRVGVARALAADPALILMDEPFGALDPITRREIQAEFRSLQQRLGKTVIFVTHDLREACRMADRLALMDHGELIQQGPAIDFLERPATEFVRSFFQDAGAVVETSEGGPV